MDKHMTLSDHLIRMATYLAFGVSGFSALLYEVVWFRALSLVLGSTTYALSTMLSTFMAGLSIGAYLGGRWADRAGNPIILFAFIEGGIAVLALLTLPLIHSIPPLYAWLYYTFRFSFTAFSASQFLLCSISMLIPTILMGATFPVVCRICYTGGGIGKETGAVYAVNTVGAIAGSLAAGFLMIPGIGLQGTNRAGALLNLLIAFFFIVINKAKVLRNTIPLAIIFMMALFATAYRPSEAYPFNIYMGYRFHSYEGFVRAFGFAEKLYEREGAQGNVKVVRFPDGSRSLINNGKIESNNGDDLLNLAILAYLPASANPEGKRFLNIGHGTGGTVFYASKIPSMEEIYSIEINPPVIEASRLFFYPGIFEDRRIRFITADARNFLSAEGRSYDIITSEPSYPVDQGFSHLYSREFYRLIRDRLDEGGVFCQWVPRYIFRGDEFWAMAKTFQIVFPGLSVWRAKGGDYLLLGRKGVGFDREKILSSVNMWLNRAGLSGKDFFLLSDPADAERRLRGFDGRINTDDRPIIEFIGARRILSSYETP